MDYNECHELLERAFWENASELDPISQTLGAKRCLFII